MKPETIHELPIDRFICEPQVREQLDPMRVEQMAQSFTTVGQLQPIRARRNGHGFTPVDGHYRLAAGTRLGWKTIAAIVEQQELDEKGILIRSLIANCQRTDLKPTEIARGIERLIDATGATAGEIAAQLGFSDAKVSDLRKLLTLSPDIIEMVDAGKIPVSAAAELARRDPAEHAELAKQLADRTLTRDGLAGARRAAKRPAKSGDAQKSRVTAVLDGGRLVTISGDDLDLEGFIQTIELLLSKARRARPQGIGLGTFIKMLKDQSQG